MKQMRTILTASFFACVFLAACSSDPKQAPSLNYSNITLKAGQTRQLISSEEGRKSIAWSSSDRFVASVSNAGLVAARKVGTATIHANGVACQVTVEPVYNLYEEPITEWGASREKIIDRHGEPEHDYGSLITYSNVSDAISLIRYFLDEDGGLNTVQMCLHEDKATGIDDFIRERYEYLRPDGPLLLYVNAFEEKDATTFVMLGLVSLSPEEDADLYWLVVYSDKKVTVGSIPGAKQYALFSDADAVKFLPQH